MKIKDNIKKLRISKAMKQKELADALGVTRTTVSNWETGSVIPNGKALSALADFFGVTTDYICFRRSTKDKSLEISVFQLCYLFLIYTAESPVALVTAGFSLWLVYCASIIRIYSDKFQAIKKSSRHIAKSSSHSNITFNVARYYYTPAEAREL